jgi:hypothetical protein
VKRYVYLIPAAFLLLSMDRLWPERFAAYPQPVQDWAQAAPMLPGRNEGRFGLPGDPLNLVFLGTPAAVRGALTEAGWTEVPTSVRGSLAAGFAEWLDGKTVAAFPPMNDYRLMGRLQAMNWAIPVRFLRERHHFRLWRTSLVVSERTFWWGSANYDRSIRWRDLSHVPDPDADRERDEVLRRLARSRFVESVALVPLPQIPREGVNDKGYPFRTDGRVALIALKTVIDDRR